MPIVQYLETQFRAIYPNAAHVRAEVYDETYAVRVDNELFLFECGSDDDEYVFVSTRHNVDRIPLMPE